MVNSRWMGKKWITLGDSITAQNGEPYGESSILARGYQTIVQEKLGLSYENLGVPGRPMANGSRNGPGTVTTGLAVSDYSIYDLATIAAGTNDFRLDVPLGIIDAPSSELDSQTFYGAYRELIEHILTSAPAIRLVLFTPLQRDKDGYHIHSVNGAGHKLNDYRKAIIELGELYSLPVCDMYANSGFTPMTLSEFTHDGLHPNDAGYERMGSYAAAFLHSIAL